MIELHFYLGWLIDDPIEPILPTVGMILDSLDQQSPENHSTTTIKHCKSTIENHYYSCTAIHTFVMENNMGNQSETSKQRGLLSSKKRENWISARRALVIGGYYKFIIYVNKSVELFCFYSFFLKCMRLLIKHILLLILITWLVRFRLLATWSAHSLCCRVIFLSFANTEAELLLSEWVLFRNSMIVLTEVV